MRISIIKGDRGYDHKHERRVKRVTLNGRPVLVATADEEEGFILELVYEDGKPKFGADGNVLLERKTGRVVVELLPEDDRTWDKRKRGEAKVQVGRCTSKPGDLLVQVYSIVRPGAIKQLRLQKDGLPSGQVAIVQKIGACAGAAAEMLAEQFGDTIDPSEAARAAVVAATQMYDQERGFVLDVTQ